jgi:hypothetical protein
VAGLGLLSGRKTAVANTTSSTSDTFYYYPKVNMYYDVARGRYIYLAQDGRTWETARTISDKLTTGMGKRAVLTNPTLPVWKNNEHHKLIYSTTLYASAADFRKDPPKKTVKATSAVAKKPAEEKKVKKESGVQRFFKRLFGKKDSTEKKQS